MALLLSAPQCFFLAIVGFGLFGFIRGWKREIISVAFTLAGVLFLMLNGGAGLAQFVFVRVPVIFQEVVSNSSTIQRPANPSPFNVLLTTLVTFVLIVALGYLISYRAFPGKTSNGTSGDRILGIIPGLVTGYFVMTYITNVFNKSPIITVGVNTPDQALISNYVPLIFVVAVAAVILGLFASRQKKSSGAKK